MNQQPDKLFQEKLGNFQRNVPSSAWNRIEKELDKKNQFGLWLKLAASLLLLAVAGILLWPASQVKNSQELISKTPVIKNSEIPVQKKTDHSEQNINNKENAEKTIERKKPTIKKKNNLPAIPDQKQKEVSEEIMVAEVILPEISLENTLEEIGIKEERTIAEMETIVAENPSPQDEGVTLKLSAEEVDNKYLNKKALAEATSEEKKPSTLRKLLDKAYDLKNNQDPFGDLRQKKNEILALNFKNEKQRSQNK